MIPEIETYSGFFINPLNPDPVSICIEDIAHALSMKCRFTGQSSKFISVAEHSMMVSSLVPKHLQRAALLHDATEAYLPDIASPVKRSRIYNEHKRYDKKLEEVIFRKYSVELSDSDRLEIKLADNICVGVEASQTLRNYHTAKHWEWVREIIKQHTRKAEACKYSFLSPYEAETIFLAMWASA